jgi:hypothetical protein
VHATLLVASVLHQPLPVIKKMSRRELFFWASNAAAMSGKEFKP